jgi:hypothetical protein
MRDEPWRQGVAPDARRVSVAGPHSQVIRVRREGRERDSPSVPVPEGAKQAQQTKLQFWVGDEDE